MPFQAAPGLLTLLDQFQSSSQGHKDDYPRGLIPQGEQDVLALLRRLL